MLTRMITINDEGSNDDCSDIQVHLCLCLRLPLPLRFSSLFGGVLITS